MTARIRTITYDCANPYTQTQFWAQVLGWPEDPDNANTPGDPEGLLVSPDGSLALLFIAGPDVKAVKHRAHLDIVPTDGTRDEEVRRLLGIGAALLDDRRREDGTGWAVLADPEGNEFCVERSEQERSG